MKSLVYLKYILLALYTALMPIKPAMISVMALPLIDLVLGLIVAVRAKQPITSSGLKRTVAKVLVYEAATILAFITEVNLVGELIPVTKMVTGLIGITELKSCLEHLDELNGSPVFASILSRLAPSQLINPPSDESK